MQQRLPAVKEVASNYRYACAVAPLSNSITSQRQHNLPAERTVPLEINSGRSQSDIKQLILLLASLIAMLTARYFPIQ